ncbi:efflux RND transporter permease subunit [uncultured Tenacibaculum sp.]|uniref:efflux RND transporter permease subunit n=1 Tax=uncultured Tenacibaculum sp. TaxID=174713 RepID=UPI002619D3DF|nr:efflux RND transporter permease subunit [uncultured Tenacibaculum sp.]
MNNNDKITQFGEWLIKRRWFILLGSIFITVLLGWGGENLRFNNDYHVYFDSDDPQIMAFDAIEEKYVKNDNVLIAVQPEDGKVFTKETLAAIQELEKRAWQTPWSSRVDALSNFQHTRAEGDDMYVENLYTDVEALSNQDLEAIKNIALHEPLLLNRSINKEASITSVNITVQIPADKDDGALQVANNVREMVKKWEKDYPGHKTYLSGVVMMNTAFAESSMNDMSTLIPIMFLIIIIAVVITTRSVSGMISAFFVLIFSIMAAMGLAGWIGIELTGPSSSAPTMIMTLAIADSIHVLVTIIQQMRNGLSKREAIKKSVSLNFKPVLLTSITTILGFLTLNFSEGSPYKDLGNITAMGVFFALLFSLFLLPALIAILPMKVKPINDEKKGKGWFDKFGNVVINKHKSILVGSMVVILGLGFISVKNELNNEFVKFFDESVDFRTDTDYISKNLTGIYNIDFSLGAGEEDGITTPSYLKVVDEFKEWLLSQEEVVHVNSFSEVFKKVNKSMHGDDASYYKIPDAKDEASQYLLLYEMSLPFGLDLNNQINVDKSETRFTATLKNISSNDLLAFNEKAEQWLKDNAPKEMFTPGVSPSIIFSRIAKSNLNNMMVSGIGALFLISILLMFVLKSFRYGAISIIPNIAPITMAFGFWYIFNGEINMGMAATLGMTLGIVVDDAIHFLSKYISARREMGKSPEEAIQYAFSSVARAIVITTIILVAGFSVLMQSSFGLNSDMAVLSVITIIAALVLDLILLPALLLLLDKPTLLDVSTTKK